MQNTTTPIILHDLQICEYNETWEKQEHLFEATIKIKTDAKKLKQTALTDNHLIFVEHPHVYTLGKSGDEDNLLLNYIQLQANDAVFVKSNRGGDITYHGPGQLVGYPIFDLENFDIGLRQFIYNMEEVVINTIKKFGLNGVRDKKATGVWLDPQDPIKARKICAIGVRSSRFVTMHGFALNVNTDLEYFKHINPCGFVDKGVTSLQAELGHEVNMNEVKAIVQNEFENIYKAKVYPL